MKTRQVLILVSLIILVCCFDMDAQCPMCKLGAETNLKGGGTAGAGLNNGILYMLSMPYLLVATLGIIWYKNRRKEGEDLRLPS